MDIYTSNPYYVYAYLREDYTPYYIGKGKGKRAYQHSSKCPIQPPVDKCRIIIISQNLSECQAFIQERYYIRWFGRKDNGTGILHNRTDGGEGGTGPKSESHKQSISKALKGYIKTEEHRANISKGQKGRVPSEGFKGHNHTDISKANIGKGLLGKTKDMVTVKDNYGNKFKIHKTDSRYISGELTPISKGRHYQYEIKICPHCGKSGKGPNMTRYHFGNCISY